MVKIEWVLNIPDGITCRYAGIPDTLYIDIQKWFAMSREEQIAVIEHEKLHDSLMNGVTASMADSYSEDFRLTYASEDQSNHDLFACQELTATGDVAYEMRRNVGDTVRFIRASIRGRQPFRVVYAKGKPYTALAITHYPKHQNEV